jgi:hypothetical protein
MRRNRESDVGQLAKISRQYGCGLRNPVHAFLDIRAHLDIQRIAFQVRCFSATFVHSRISLPIEYYLMVYSAPWVYNCSPEARDIRPVIKAVQGGATLSGECVP